MYHPEWSQLQVPQNWGGGRRWIPRAWPLSTDADLPPPNCPWVSLPKYLEENKKGWHEWQINRPPGCNQVPQNHLRHQEAGGENHQPFMNCISVVLPACLPRSSVRVFKLPLEVCRCSAFPFLSHSLTRGSYPLACTCVPSWSDELLTCDSYMIFPFPL